MGSKTINMSFVCDQDWNAMTPTSLGRFCDACRREVIDYTTTPVNKILADKAAANAKICGLFTLEQVDPTLLKPIELRRLKTIAVFTSLLLALVTKTTYGKPRATVQTEQTENRKQIFPFIHEVKNDSLCKKEPYTFDPTGKTPFLTTKKKSYYWSSRFPFVKKVYRRRRMMGFL